MGRIKRGWQLTKKAWGVVRENPGLMKLPVYGGILAFLAFVVFSLPGLVIIESSDTNAAYVGGGALVALGIYLGSFFIIYFNVALAAACDMVFRGEPADTKVGLNFARRRRGVIAQWALVSLIVSMIFNLIRDRGGLAGQIAAGLGAAIWALVTFLIAPVLAFENVGPIEALKRSATMFKQKWGEQITGDIAIGVITGIVMFISILVAVGGVFVLLTGDSALVVAGGGLLLLGIVGFFAATIVSSAVRGVFGVALYRYIVDGAAAGPFSAEELEGSVKPKKGARPAGI